MSITTTAIQGNFWLIPQISTLKIGWLSVLLSIFISIFIQYWSYRKKDQLWLLFYYFSLAISILFANINPLFSTDSSLQLIEQVLAVFLLHSPMFFYLWFTQTFFSFYKNFSKYYIHWRYLLYAKIFALSGMLLIFWLPLFWQQVFWYGLLGLELSFWLNLSLRTNKTHELLSFNYTIATVLFFLSSIFLFSAYQELGLFCWLIAWIILGLMLEYRNKSIENLRKRKQEHLLERLYQKQQEQRQARTELEEKVKNRTNEIEHQKEELEKQSGKLRAAYRKLKELDQFKEALTGMILHDLKNPLNVIIGLSAENTAIHQSGKQMLNMILNILDIQKFQDTRIKLFLSNYAPNVVAERALSQVDFLAKDKNIKVINNIPQQYWVKADEELVERIFINLLTNAIKYTPNNGTIILDALNTDKKQLYISVSDNGQGIPKKYLKKIFDKYGQVQARKSGIVRSTGLGLTFCKMVVEAHGGKIWAESEMERGSTFWFTLPYSEVRQERHQQFEPDSSYKNVDEIIAGKDKRYDNPLSDKLSAEERYILIPYLEKLQALEVYDATKIKKLLDKIDLPNKALEIWKEEIEGTLFVCNQDRYIALLQIE